MRLYQNPEHSINYETGFHSRPTVAGSAITFAGGGHSTSAPLYVTALILQVFMTWYNAIER